MKFAALLHHVDVERLRHDILLPEEGLRPVDSLQASTCFKISSL